VTIGPSVARVATPRRTGTETSETRAKLLDITERVMVEDGYAAVSSRRVAKDAGVTPALVHYYFPTLDDLFLEVLRRRRRQQLDRLDRLLAAEQPLRSLWSFSTEHGGAVLLTEFMALANHRKSIRQELAAAADEFRRVEVEALAQRLEAYGVDPDEIPPEVVLVVMSSLARSVVTEQDLGMTTGLAEARELIERFLERWEGPAPG
jgi:AcrR family transcriptional regulator